MVTKWQVCHLLHKILFTSSILDHIMLAAELGLGTGLSVEVTVVTSIDVWIGVAVGKV